MPAKHFTRLLLRDWIFLLFLGALLYLAYKPILKSFFFFANDFDLMEFSNLRSTLANWDRLDWSPRTPRLPLITRAIYSALFSLFSLDGWKYAAFCVVLHWTNACLVFFLARRLIRDEIPARWSAVLFSLLPASVFAAAYLVSTLRQVLGTCFTLSSMHLFALFLRDSSKKHYTASIILFLLGLQTHELAATAPFIMILEIWAGNTSSKPLLQSSRAKAIWPFICIGIGYLILGRMVYLARVDINFAPEHYFLGWHTLKNIPAYCATLVWPARETMTWQWMVAAAMTAVMAISGLPQSPRRVVMFSLGALIMALSPFLIIKTLSLADMGKYAYFASVYFCVLLGLACWKISLKPYGWAFPLLLAGAWAYHTHQICRYQTNKREAERGCLEILNRRTCKEKNPDFIDGAVNILWPEAEVFWLSSSRIENYLTARCGGRRFNVKLHIDAGLVPAGTAAIDCR